MSALEACALCGDVIDRGAVARELCERTGDIHETCERAARASVFCGLDCALADVGRPTRPVTPSPPRC
jgi:hypothetical protein